MGHRVGVRLRAELVGGLRIHDHLFMGDSNNSFSGINPTAAAFVNDRISQNVDMITVRFNYRFGGYGAPPVVSKY